MRPPRLFRLAVAAVLLASCSPPPAPATTPPPVAPTAEPAPMTTPPPAAKSPFAYPPTPRGDVKDVLHGVEVRDPYRWLEPDPKTDPRVADWLKAQDDYARAELAKLPGREAIRARLKELFYVDTISAPVHRKGRYFWTQRRADQEKSVVYWKQGKTGEPKVLLDPNAWSTDGSVSLGGWVPDPKGEKVAYRQKKNNSDEATLYVLDVASGKTSTVDVIDGAKYASASWTPKGDGFYYTWLPTDPAIPTADRPGYAEVRYHKLGDDPKKDRLVHEKTGDATKFIGADVSRDGRFLFLAIHHGWTASDVYVQDLKAPPPKPKDGKTASPKDAFVPLAVGLGAHFDATAFQGKLYLFTDKDAPNGKMFVVDPAKLGREHWKEIVPERPDATLSNYGVLGGRLVLHYLKNASSLVEVHALDGKLERTIALPGIGTVGGPTGNDDEDEAYFSFASFTVPDEIHALSMKTGKTDLFARLKVPVDPKPYVTEQVFFPSKDGTKVSMFIVRPKDLKLDGSARVMLRGYGGFMISETPSFQASAYPWLERGGVYVVTNLRGGGEYGEAWHQAGMLLKKQNVFDDYVAAAEYLVKNGYTKPSRLVIQGGSNGGLLMGAAVTQRPDLFGAVLCHVPLLDMVRYHLSGSGRTWISEYGSADDPEQFKALYAYSPYHHVKDGVKYPPVLMLTADSDDRVDPMHARKFAASLQAASSGGPVLVRVERNAGHGGADLVKAAVEKGADAYVFALAMTADPKP